MHPVSTIDKMTLDGGIPCLDFVNSGYDTQKDVVTERLHTYADLLVLAERHKLLSKHTISALRAKAADDADTAKHVLARALQLRGYMFLVFKGLAHDQSATIDPEVLEALNREFADASSQRLLTALNGRLVWLWDERSADLRLPVWMYVYSAYELLSRQDQLYLKQCCGCEWLFIDATKNHGKRWCNMQVCGSVDKSRRYYRKKKSEKPPASV